MIKLISLVIVLLKMSSTWSSYCCLQGYSLELHSALEKEIDYINIIDFSAILAIKQISMEFLNEKYIV